jgi:hypothetical protein
MVEKLTFNLLLQDGSQYLPAIKACSSLWYDLAALSDGNGDIVVNQKMPVMAAGVNGGTTQKRAVHSV